MTNYEIAVMPGDGIGPEVIDAALAVLKECEARYGLKLNYTFYDFSADLYRRTGKKITPADMDQIGKADAVLFGAMGLPDVRGPEGLELGAQVEMRAYYGLFASLRPTRLYPGVDSPVKAKHIDMLVIRETSEGMFAGLADEHEPSDVSATDRMTITRATCEKLFEVAFLQARARRRNRGTPGHVTLLHKSNALRSNVLMEKVFDEVAAKHGDIGSAKFYIDAGSMYMVTNPERYDVVVSENIFGDIVSEIAAGLVGGLGVAPSADISFTHGVFQPSHGSAPDIAGKGIANPTAMILSAAMMLEWLGERRGDALCTRVAQNIQTAVEAALAKGPRPRDLGGTAGTQEVVNAVVSALPA